MKVFLINLDRSTDRLRSMVQQFDSQGIQFERMPAVDGNKVPDWLKGEFEDSHRTMMRGEIGCYASHLCIAREVVERGLEYAVVLEDDAVIVDNFVAICEEAVSMTPREWDYIHLSSNFKRPVFTVAKMSGGVSLIRHVQRPLNTAAYILSRSGAQSLLKSMPRIQPIDQDIRHTYRFTLDVLGVYPAAASQATDTKSTICDKYESRKLFNQSKVLDAVYLYKLVGIRGFFRLQFGTWKYRVARKLGGEKKVVLI